MIQKFVFQNFSKDRKKEIGKRLSAVGDVHAGEAKKTSTKLKFDGSEGRTNNDRPGRKRRGTEAGPEGQPTRKADATKKPEASKTCESQRKEERDATKTHEQNIREPTILKERMIGRKGDRCPMTGGGCNSKRNKE